MTATLVLQDGTAFRGTHFGALGAASGPVLFHTGGTAALRSLADPEGAGHILCMTFPLIGNTGATQEEMAAPAFARGLIAREACGAPSHYECAGTLNDYCKKAGVVGLCEIDTRALTRHIRDHGVQSGTIASEGAAVGNGAPLPVPGASGRYELPGDGPRLAVLDGCAQPWLLRALKSGLQGAHLVVLPAGDAAAALACGAQGVVALGDAQVTGVLGKLPLLCIGAAARALGREAGFQERALAAPHLGAQPVRDIARGRVYPADEYRLWSLFAEPASAQVTHRHVNDAEVEGFALPGRRALAVCFRPSPDPADDGAVYGQFLQLLGAQGKGA